MSQLTKIQQSFQRSLTTYDQYAYVQRSIAQTLNEYLLLELKAAGTLLSFRHIFEIGCGTGFFSKHLMDNMNSTQWTFNDLVHDCDAILQSNISSHDQSNDIDWDFLSGDIETVSMPKGLDLVCSASALQWVQNIPALLDKLSNRMLPNGWIALSSFGPNHFVELRHIQQQLDQNFSPLNYLSEEAWQNILNEKFDVKIIKTHSRVERFDSVENVLKHLRKTGVNGNARQQWNYSKMGQFIAAYEAEYCQGGQVSLSYEPMYIIAQLREKTA